MKKITLTLLAAVACIMTANAQILTAVLTHSGVSKTYKDRSAFQDAYKDAVDGDLITLSQGTFDAVPTIDKTITIRGAGMERDDTYNSLPTIISGDMFIEIPKDNSKKLRIEGIYSTSGIFYYSVQNLEIVKCRINEFSYLTKTVDGSKIYGELGLALFYHCKVTAGMRARGTSQITCINCYLGNPQNVKYNDAIENYFNLQNCMIDSRQRKSSAGNTYDNAYLVRASLTNCIVSQYNLSVSDSGNMTYGTENTNFTNCILPSRLQPDLLRNSYHSYDSYAKVFKSYSGTYSDDQKFELTDTAKGWLGTDGTEIGINGGPFPFTARLTGPHIKEVKVAPYSSQDGKLKVTLQIENVK